MVYYTSRGFIAGLCGVANLENIMCLAVPIRKNEKALNTSQIVKHRKSGNQIQKPSKDGWWQGFFSLIAFLRPQPFLTALMSQTVSYSSVWDVQQWWSKFQTWNNSCALQNQTLVNAEHWTGIPGRTLSVCLSLYIYISSQVGNVSSTDKCSRLNPCHVQSHALCIPSSECIKIIYFTIVLSPTTWRVENFCKAS